LLPQSNLVPAGNSTNSAWPCPCPID
jgi:hypothetical protein